jgi:hypothetical protein
MSNLSQQQENEKLVDVKCREKRIFKRTGQFEEDHEISQQVIKEHTENLLKARAKNQTPTRVFPAIGSVQADKESRFILTKRNSSIMMDSKEIPLKNLPSFQKPVIEVKEEIIANHYEEGLLIRSRSIQTAPAARRELQNSSENWENLWLLEPQLLAHPQRLQAGETD